MKSTKNARRARVFLSRGNRRGRRFSLVGFASAVVMLLVVFTHESEAQPNFQSCLNVGCTSGAMSNTFYGMVTRSFGGCPASCVATGTNIYLCQGAGSFLLAHFSMASSDTVTRGCDFSCPGQTTMMQNCSIRGVDGLPVELMSFGLD